MPNHKKSLRAKLAVAAFAATAAFPSASIAADFCTSIRSLVEAASTDFKNVRGELEAPVADNSDSYKATLLLPDAEYCSVDIDKNAAHASTYRCHWAYKNNSDAKGAIDRIINGLKACDIQSLRLVKPAADGTTFGFFAEKNVVILVGSFELNGEARVSFSIHRHKEETPKASAALIQSDYIEILRQVVVVLDREDGPITSFIAPADANADLVAALKTVAKTVQRAKVPKSAKYTLPKGYFIVEKIDADRVVGIAGPGALKGTLGADIDCGKRYSILFSHTNGKWLSGSYAVQECAP